MTEECSNGMVAGKKYNCWEYKQCGRESGGKYAHEFGVCPAAVENRLDGVNLGRQGGRACWNVAGTLCNGKVQGTYAAKLSSCLNCNFYQLVCDEEKQQFELVSKLESPGLLPEGYQIRARILFPITAILFFIIIVSLGYYHFSLRTAIAVVSIVSVGLLSFLYFFLTKIDKNLKETSQELRRQIQDRRLAEEGVRASEERYRAITATAMDAIFIADRNAFVTFWNPAAEKLFDCTSADMSGRKITSFFATGDMSIDGLVPSFFTQPVEKNDHVVEWKGVKKDGKFFPVEISHTPVDLGRDWFTIYMVRDVTKQKESEQERLRLQSQIRHSQKLEAIGTLAGGIAHDFNNILSAILGFASLARDGCENDSQLHADLNQITKAGQRARALVKQILTFSRQGEEEKSPIQIQFIIKEALKLLRPSIPATIEIHSEIDPHCGAILGDPTQIHQILMNLCTNAYHAMKEKGGVLSLSLTNIVIDEKETKRNPELNARNYALLTIKDTGCGMDPMTMSHIFEPYFTTKGLGEGTGLGLAVVHGIAKSHNGLITVESELGKGSIFRVYLPLLERDASAPEEIKEICLARGTEHILVVDDEAPIVELLQKQLQRLGYVVTTRTSSVEALHLFQADPNRFDLVITDQTMPNMTGVAMIREMKLMRAKIPIVLSTGFSEELKEESLNKFGIDALLHKPIENVQLTDTIRRLLDRKASGGNVNTGSNPA